MMCAKHGWYSWEDDGCKRCEAGEPDTGDGQCNDAMGTNGGLYRCIYPAGHWGAHRAEWTDTYMKGNPNFTVQWDNEMVNRP